MIQTKSHARLSTHAQPQPASQRAQGRTASLARGSVLSALCGVILGACSPVGPDYVRPTDRLPSTFVEAGPWREAIPGDLAARGNWWEVFGDPTLNDIETRAKKTNLGLQAAAARLRQAQAIAGISGSFLYPEISFAPSAVRYGVSETRPDQPSKQSGNVAYAVNDFRIPLYASYEVDLWGKVRRLSEASGAQAAASQAAYFAVMLTLEGDIAQTYFLIRASDEEVRILRENISLRMRARDFVAARRQSGLSSELDLVRAETELAFTQAEAEAASKRRTELTYTLAVLVGVQPEEFRLEERTFELSLPAIPVGLPADLLERRPDIAEAERRLAARNAEIGVAKAAYFPSIRLTGAIGFESFDLGQVLDRSSTIWSLGASLWQPVFNSGRVGFDVERAQAAYDENLAVYREKLLKAFQEVETALAALRILAQQARYQAVALENSSKATRLATARYQGGLVSFIEVVDAQRVSLQARRQALQVLSTQMLTTVALVKSLGGGWDERSAESHSKIEIDRREIAVREAR